MNLDKLRIEIDNIDAEIVKLIGERFILTRQVGEFKKNNEKPSIDIGREEDVLNKWNDLAVKYNVDQDLSRLIIRSIIDKVVNDHNRIKNKA
jgi:chorismate mutase